MPWGVAFVTELNLFLPVTAFAFTDLSGRYGVGGACRRFWAWDRVGILPGNIYVPGGTFSTRLLPPTSNGLKSGTECRSPKLNQFRFQVINTGW